jgi:hypothetical protein
VNLIDAIKSGRPIRRRGRSSWPARDTGFGTGYHICDPARDQWLDPEYYLETMGCKEDILADDWEIQEPSVTITRSQFWDAVGRSQVSQADRFPATWLDAHVLAKALGLEGGE